MILVRADINKQYNENARLRLMLYTLSLPNIKEECRVDIYDWMPLSGDPSKEEREKQKVADIVRDEQLILETIRKHKR